MAYSEPEAMIPMPLGDEESHYGYWAADEDARAVVSALSSRRSKIDELANPLIAKLLRSEEYFYRMLDSGMSDTAITLSGSHGQLLDFHANYYKYLGLQLKTLITQDRPAFSVSPANTGARARVQARVGRQVLDHYLEHGVEVSLRIGFEYALAYGLGFLSVTWDPSLGQIQDADEDKQIFQYEGDVRIRPVHLRDVVFDYHNKSDWNDLCWIAVRSFRNKFDLVAQFPDKKDAICSAESKRSDFLDEADWRKYIQETDDVEVWEFFHKRTDCMPEGRYILFVADEPLIDMPSPYRRLPIYPIYGGRVPQSLLGYSPLFDIQPHQEFLDELLSKLVSIQDALGLPILWGETGSSQPNPSSWMGSIAWVESQKKPEVVELGNVPPTLYQSIQLLVSQMETLVGINAIIQGRAEGSVRANRMQLFSSEQALRLNSDLQAEYYKAFEAVGTAVLEILRDFAQTERVIQLSGPRNSAALLRFSGEDLYDVTSVKVSPTNAAMKTVDGRLEVIDILTRNQVPLPKEELISILEGAPLGAMTEAVESENDIVAAENDELLAGGAHHALATDNHLFHVRKHASLLSTPQAREDEVLSQSVLAAMLEHIQLSMDPQVQLIQAALGYTPVAPPMPQIPGQQPAPEQNLPPEDQPQQPDGNPQEI